MKPHFLFSFFCGCALLTAGCAPTLIASGAAVGASATEERSLSNNASDKFIKAEITRSFVESDVHGMLLDVNIEVDEGRVMLTGIVPNQKISSEAARLAWLAKDVKEVINDIKTGEPLSIVTRSNDTLITSQIRSRLLATKNILSLNYTIEVVNGVAYLLGVAQNSAELDSVSYIAAHTHGVTKVVSHVRLKNSQQRTQVNPS